MASNDDLFLWKPAQTKNDLNSLYSGLSHDSSTRWENREATALIIEEIAGRMDETALRIDETTLRIDETALWIQETMLRIDETALRIDETTLRIDETALVIKDELTKDDPNASTHEGWT